MLRHNKTCHPEEINNPPDFEMKVTQIYKNKPLDRQLSDVIQINSLSNYYAVHKFYAHTFWALTPLFIDQFYRNFVRIYYSTSPFRC